MTESVLQKDGFSFLFKGSCKAIPFNIIAATLLSIEFFYSQMPFYMLASWYAVIVLISCLRLAFSKNALNHYHADKTKTTVNIFVFLTFMMGLVWGSYYFIATPYFVGTNEIIVVLMYGGVCAGALGSLSVHLPAYLAYISPILLPLTVYNFNLMSSDRILLAVMYLFFIFMLTISALLYNRMLHQFFRLSIEKENLIKQLEKSATTDHLTQLSNRRHFETVYDEEFKCARERGHSLNMISIDIDNFKLINDTYGHPEGDAYLKYISKMLNTIFPELSEYIFRFGGDEFIIIAKDVNFENAIQLSNNLNKQLKHANQDFCQNNHYEYDDVFHQVSLSIGVICVPPHVSYSSDAVMRKLDRVLYASKAEGKNQVASRILF